MSVKAHTLFDIMFLDSCALLWVEINQLNFDFS